MDYSCFARARASSLQHWRMAASANDLGAKYHLGSATILPAVHAAVAVCPISALPCVSTPAVVGPAATLAIRAYPAFSLRTSRALALLASRASVGSGVASCKPGDEELATSGTAEVELGRWMGWWERRIQLQHV